MFKLVLSHLFVLTLILNVNICFGQLEKKLLPFIHNIPFSNFPSENINQIDKNDSGIFFIATHSGLIETDGVNHNKYSLGKLTDLEGLHVLNDSLIYSCGYGGFGKWLRSKTGVFKYEPIYFKEPSSNDYLQPTFNNVLQYKNKIVFHAHNQLYFYDETENHYHIKQAPDYLSKIFLIDDNLFGGTYGGDIYSYNDGKFTLVTSVNAYESSVVYFDSYRNNEKILITQNGMLWTLGDKGPILEKSLPNTKINSAIVDESGQILLGTERNGIIFLNDQFENTRRITKSSGLSSNSVYTLFIDFNNIWVITDQGVDVLLDSLVSVLSEEGDLGLSYDYHLDGTSLLKATDKGLFKMDLKSENTNFELIPGSEGINWDIDEIDGIIFIGHERGVFTFNNDQLKLIHKDLGVWNFRQHPEQDNLIFCGTYNGILILKRKENQWGFYKRLDGFYDSSRFMEFDEYYLWVNHPAKGFFLITLSDNFEDIKSLSFYDNFDFSDLSFYSYLFKINQEIIFYDSGSFFQYNYSDKIFYESKKYNSIFSGLKNLESFVTSENDILFLTSGGLGILNHAEKNPQIDFASFGSRLVKPKGDFSKLSNINSEYYLINTDKKTLVYKQKKIIKPKKTNILVEKPVISKIYNRGMSYNKSLELNFSEQQKISFENNTIEFDFFIPNYIYNPHHVIEWKLEKDSTWNILNNKNTLTFSGLKTGLYNLRIRINDLQGNKSEELRYSFKVLQAWYLSKSALLIYFILIAFAFYLIIYIKNIKSEKKLLALNRQKLKLEVENHNNELAFQSYLNIEKNELLTRLKTYFFKSNKSDHKGELPLNIRQIVNEIEKQFEQTDDWVKFDFHFKKANPDFFKNLQNTHPNLTSNDLRLCSFIKSNLPNKQIAKLMVITPKSLEMSRYRLRKKMGLTLKTDLFKYLSKL